MNCETVILCVGEKDGFLKLHEVIPPFVSASLESKALHWKWKSSHLTLTSNDFASLWTGVHLLLWFNFLKSKFISSLNSS